MILFFDLMIRSALQITFIIISTFASFKIKIPPNSAYFLIENML